MVLSAVQRPVFTPMGEGGAFECNKHENGKVERGSNVILLIVFTFS